LTINKEDHTLANMLCSFVLLPSYPVPSSVLTTALLSHPSSPYAPTLAVDSYPSSSVLSLALSQLLLQKCVLFAGYRVPHPLESRVELKVQTDGTETPIVAVQNAIQSLIVLLGRVKSSFQQEVLKKKAYEGDEAAADNMGFF
jgi:DNA-directed RNA polymerase II subunit RPB11